VPIEQFIAVLACHETRLIVEVDGGQQDPLSEREATHARFPKGKAYA